jgi:predicted lipoprotein with Yx(FWY)xxD motif
MHLRSKPILALGSALLLALAVTACGGDDDSDSGSAEGSGAGQTVATESISGVGDVLVESSGMALYTNDVDTQTKIVCTNQCAAEWLPLAAPTGGQPTSDDSAVEDELGTVQRPDGSSQVTFGGLPLYTFAQDSPGEVTGNGFSDSFGGTNFVWTVAGVSGEETPSTTTEQPSGGYGY